MNDLVAALRQKFDTPQDALQALGLDAALLEEGQSMPSAKPRSPKLSPAAIATRAGLRVYLLPRLAQDSRRSVDFSALVTGINSQNYAQRVPGLIDAVCKATNGKLAQDADIQDLANLLNALRPDAESADQMTAPSAAPPPAAMGGAPAQAPPPGTVPNAPADGEPEDTLAKIKAYLEQQGVSPEIINNLDAFLAEHQQAGGEQNGGENNGGENNGGEPPAGDEELEPRGEAHPDDIICDDDDEEEKARKRRALEGEDEVIPSEQKDLVTRDSMNKAIKHAQDAAIKNQRDIRAAERFVRPWTGEMAMDSAASPADVYRAALKALNVRDADKLHPDALRPVLEAQPKPSRRVAQDRAVAAGIAADHAPKEGFLERFPMVKGVTVLQ